MSLSVRRIWSVLGAALVALGILVLPVAPASAHAQVISSSPASGERLETSPTEILITVSEPADVSSVVLSLSGPQGPVTTLGPAQERARDASGHQTIAVPVTAVLGTGLYRMTFTARSTVDGHTASSEVVFGMRTDVSAPAAADNSASTDTAADLVRGALQGLLPLAAGLAFGLLVLGPVAAGRGRRLAGAAALTAVVASVGVGLLWHEGNGLVVSVAGVLGAGLLWYVSRQDLAARAQTALAGLGLVLAVAPLALVGHAAAQGDLMTMIAVLHIVTISAWVGVVAAAAVLLRGQDRADRLPVLARTSVVAGSTFLVALVSGLLMSAAMVPSVGGLVGSVYGWGLLLKVALLIPVLGLALVTRTRLRMGRSTSIVVEAGLLVAVAVVGIFVATQPPPASARFQPTPSWSADTAAVSTSADDLLVTAQIDPNTPGTRFLVVRVDDTRRPAPATVTAVSASLADGVSHDLVRGADGQWTGSVTIESPGPMALDVVVTRPGMSDALAATTWTVAPRTGTLSGGAPLTRYVAVAVAGLVVAWLLLLVVEGLAFPRRRRAEGEDEATLHVDELVSEAEDSLRV